MGIIIKKIDNDYCVHIVSHAYVNLTPFTNPDAIQRFTTYMNSGKIKDLSNLEVDTEYEEMDINDFEVVERISQVKHSNGLVYDDLTYRLKPVRLIVK